MDWREYIEQRPEVMMGKPVIKGTRLTVESILERLGDGWSAQALMESFPEVRTEHIQATQAYAAAWLALDENIFRKTGTERSFQSVSTV
jgi:uncharacterized protein (DUF433 family)